MAQRSQADWRTLIEAQASSGMTAAAFCRKHGINQKYFSFRRRQLGARPVSVSKFVPVVMSGASSAAVFRLRVGSDMALELPQRVDAAWLAELLRALKD